jgi:hypothetical protein
MFTCLNLEDASKLAKRGFVLATISRTLVSDPENESEVPSMELPGLAPTNEMMAKYYAGGMKKKDRKKLAEKYAKQLKKGDFFLTAIHTAITAKSNIVFTCSDEEWDSEYMEVFKWFIGKLFGITFCSKKTVKIVLKSIKKAEDAHKKAKKASGKKKKVTKSAAKKSKDKVKSLLKEINTDTMIMSGSGKKNAEALLKKYAIEIIVYREINGLKVNKKRILKSLSLVKSKTLKKACENLSIKPNTKKFQKLNKNELMSIIYEINVVLYGIDPREVSSDIVNPETAVREKGSKTE